MLSSCGSFKNSKKIEYVTVAQTADVPMVLRTLCPALPAIRGTDSASVYEHISTSTVLYKQCALRHKQLVEAVTRQETKNRTMQEVVLEVPAAKK